MKVTVGFSKHKGFAPLSWLIIWGEKVPFSHTYFKLRQEKLDRVLIYEATGRGVNFINETRWLENNEIVQEMELDIPDINKQNFYRKAIDNLGTPYGYKQLLGLVLVRLLNLVNIKIQNPFSDGNKTNICLELLAEMFRDLNVIQNQDIENMGMQEWFNLAEKLEEKKNG